MNVPRNDVLPTATEFEQKVVYYAVIDTRYTRITMSFDGTYGRTEIGLYRSQQEMLTGNPYYTRGYRGMSNIPDKYHTTCVKLYELLRSVPKGKCKLIRKV